MKWIFVSWSVGFCVKLSTKPGDCDTLWSHKPWLIITYCVEWPTWIWWNVIASGPGPGHICPYATLEAGDHKKTQSQFQMVWPLNEFQSPSKLWGRGPWPEWKVALTRPLHSKEQVWGYVWSRVLILLNRLVPCKTWIVVVMLSNFVDVSIRNRIRGGALLWPDHYIRWWT